jgi:hypothetical protein
MKGLAKRKARKQNAKEGIVYHLDSKHFTNSGAVVPTMMKHIHI